MCLPFLSLWLSGRNDGDGVTGGSSHSNGVQNGPIVAENYHKNRANSVRDFKKSTKDENWEGDERWETEASWLGSLGCCWWWLRSNFLIFPSYALSFLLFLCEYLILIRISHFTIKLIGHAAAGLHPGLAWARQGMQSRHRRKGVARGRHRVSSPRGCLSLAAFDAPSLGRTWDPRSVANLCKYWHRHRDKERDRDRDSAPVRQLN